jgi:NTP pyrophosphatase (non-canonical NTP hydrolase)
MEIKEIQRLSAEIVDKIDKELNLNRDVQLNLSQLVEELGELARAVNLEKLRNKKPELQDLENEFADVFLQLAKLADFFGIDLEKSVLDKIETLKQRHNL